MTINTRTVQGSLRLDELQQRIRGTEDNLGVLRNFGLTDAGGNRLTFDSLGHFARAPANGSGPAPETPAPDLVGALEPDATAAGR